MICDYLLRTISDNQLRIEPALFQMQTASHFHVLYVLLDAIAYTEYNTDTRLVFQIFLPPLRKSLSSSSRKQSLQPSRCPCIQSDINKLQPGSKIGTVKEDGRYYKKQPLATKDGRGPSAIDAGCDMIDQWP